MTKNTPLPGEARAEGPSIADTLRSDAVPAPAPLLETAYTFLGDQDISTSRYTSRDFFEQEMEKVWAKSWQWACREGWLVNPDGGFAPRGRSWIDALSGVENQFRELIGHMSQIGFEIGL